MEKHILEQEAQARDVSMLAKSEKSAFHRLDVMKQQALDNQRKELVQGLDNKQKKYVEVKELYDNLKIWIAEGSEISKTVKEVKERSELIRQDIDSIEGLNQEIENILCQINARSVSEQINYIQKRTKNKKNLNAKLQEILNTHLKFLKRGNINNDKKFIEKIRLDNDKELEERPQF